MNWRLHLRQRRKQAGLAPNSWRPIYSGAKPAIKVPMPCYSFSKSNISIWHRLPVLPSRKLKHSKFSRRTYSAQKLLERVRSDVMGPFIEEYCAEKYCLLFIDEMSIQAFIKTLKSRSEVAAATPELIKKEQRRTQESLVYLRNDGAKDCKTKVLQEFLRQEGTSHEVTER